MWVARVTFQGDKALFGKRCKKYGVRFSGYLLSSYHKDSDIHIFISCFLFGKDSSIKSFLNDLKKDERVVNLEANSNFIIAETKEPLKHRVAYNETVFHIEPVCIDDEGNESWTLGSWNRENLIAFLDVVEKDHDAKLISIKNEKVDKFSIMSIDPSITDKQRKAIELAIEEGYYDYPRRVELQELAKKRNLSYSTFHAHLRKAEQKMLPFLFGKNNREFVSK